MSIDKQELVRRVSQRVERETGIVETIVDATILQGRGFANEEICESLQQGDSVSLRNFGTFYVRVEPKSWVFKFNPSQRLRKLFGWASTSKT